MKYPVIASKNLEKPFNPQKEPLYLVSTFVEFLIISPRPFAAAFWRATGTKPLLAAF
jgi:hypothetical protein